MTSSLIRFIQMPLIVPPQPPKKNLFVRKIPLVWGNPAQKDKVLFIADPTTQRPIRISCIC